ncbi:MAG: NUDIX domain-containing protein [Microthrixaceae bacterium]
MTEKRFDPGSLPHKRVAAGVLLTNSVGDVLLVDPVYKEFWEVPGGLVEAGESPREAARRECDEELGLQVDVGDALVVHYSDGGRTPGDAVLFIFDGGTTDRTEFVLQADEVGEARFIGPSDVHDFLMPIVADRILAALRAREAGSTLYLER